MQSLPIELVTAALEYLPQQDLRRAASVSRNFYQAATYAGIYVHRTLTFEYLPSLETFDAVLEHAALKTACPDISVSFVCEREGLPRNEGAALMHRIFHLIQKALPFLVYLRIFVPGRFTPALYDVLRLPAPRLRFLALGQAENWRTTTSLNLGPLPGDLFWGLTGRLREVMLVLPSLDPDWHPIPAFGHVRRANIFLTKPGPYIAVGRVFPSVRALLLDVSFRRNLEPTAISTPDLIDLTGLELQHLAIFENLVPLVRSDVPLRDIRILEHITKSAEWDETLWPDGARSSELNAHFARGGRGLLAEFRPARGADSPSLSPLDSHWTRLLRAPHSVLATPLAIHACLPHLQHTLVSLILDTAFLAGFLCCSVSLDALRELWIDLTCQNLESHRELYNCDSLPREQIALSCPVLKTVTVFCLSPTVVQVRAEKVAAIGLALGMRERAEEERAIVRLVRARFVEPATRNRLRRVFSQVIEQHPLELAFLRRYFHCICEASSWKATAFDAYSASDMLHY